MNKITKYGRILQNIKKLKLEANALFNEIISESPENSTEILGRGNRRLIKIDAYERLQFDTKKYFEENPDWKDGNYVKINKVNEQWKYKE